MGQKRRRRLTQVSTLCTRERREGGSQPGARRRLLKRGALYRVCRARRERLTPRRRISSSRTCSPRCVSSAAQSTSPFPSWRTAMPVVFAPGSILRRSGATTASGFASRKITVKGKRRKTAALPVSSRIRARAGVQGIRGCRLASTTKTRDIIRLLPEAPYRGSAAWYLRYQTGKVFPAHLVGGHLPDALA